MKKHVEAFHMKHKIVCDMQCEICLKKHDKNEQYSKHMETFHKDGYDCGARCNSDTNAFHCEKCKSFFFSLLAFRVHNC